MLVHTSSPQATSARFDVSVPAVEHWVQLGDELGVVEAYVGQVLGSMPIPQLASV